MDLKHQTRAAALVGVAITAATVAVYWPVLHYGFINYDDLDYITQNNHVRTGLTWSGVRWAFTEFYALNWHPVTWLSHMLDWQLFGASAGGHHGTNLALHAVNTLLVGGLLWRLSGAFWRSMAVAALFALHPLQVESVAWVSERKNVLSVMLGLLSLCAYVKYAAAAGKSPSNARSKHRGNGGPAKREQEVQLLPGPRGFQSLLASAATILKRFAGHSTRKKREGGRDDSVSRANTMAWLCYALAILLFALGLMSKPILVSLPFMLLLLDWWPLRRLAWPFGAQPGSVQPDHLHRLKWVVIEKVPFFLLSILSCAVTVSAQRSGGGVLGAEDMTLGGRLGNAAIAYVRYVGKALWPSDLAAFYPHPGHWPSWQVAASAAILLVATAALLYQGRRRPSLITGWFWFLGTLVPVIGLVQVGWQAMADRYAYLPLVGLFLTLVWGGAELLEAVARRRETDLGLLVRRCAAGGMILVLSVCAFLTSRQLRYWSDSELLFAHTLAVTPENPFAQCYLGNALVEKGKLPEGIRHLQRAAQLRKVWPEVHYSLAYALGLKGEWSSAATHYRRALEFRPDYPSALNNLAWLLATCPEASVRNGPEALRLAEHACRLTGFSNSFMVGTLAAGYAECGRFREAYETASKASKIAAESGDQGLAKVHLELRKIYASGKPYHQPAAGR